MTQWYATNTLPSLRDLSPATLEKRCRLIRLNRSFLGEDRDVTLSQKLARELPGIFSWCLELAGGMAVLARQPSALTVGAGAGGKLEPIAYVGGFLDDIPSSVKEKAAWRLDADPVQQFAAECLVVADPRAFTESGALFKAWQEWAEGNGVTLKLATRSLVARLAAMHPTLTTGDDARRGRKRGVVGLAICEGAGA